MPDLFILSFSAGKQNKALRAGQLRGTGGTDAHLHLPLLRAQRELRRFWKGFLCSCAPQGRQKIPISPSGGDLCELLSVEPNPAARLGRICWSLGSPDSRFCWVPKLSDRSCLVFGVFVPKWAGLCSQEGVVCRPGCFWKVLCLKI